MNKTVDTIIFSGLLLLSQISLGATLIDTTFWKCKAHDAENRDWYGHNDYQLTAINRAFEACKRQSRVPATCKTSKQDCEMIVNGMSIRPMWRCVALDEAATPWMSNIYDDADDAAIAAKAYCQENSAIPETCYVYPFTCRNLNPRKL
ncbi:Uncharacterised protein [Legionella lansingensis]|uniref:DUF4189 domain-containing protein n=1 Tax=Legionella lansingensis TaxID=45067 RepID=A0A0W0VTP6_9GAMM|nr:hypothetical protein [Legionella lansingensis]KTD23441.1 hypothetical protein Llan_0812 [Legionella lansingensis]SNV50897.1 Uncharacterised protein [Legionella lansingensis]